MNFFKEKTHIIVIIAIILFIIVEFTPTINMPEPVGDEAAFAMGIFRLIKNEPYYPYTIEILGRHLPFMSTYKHGALEYYLLFPFLLFGNITFEAMRTGVVFWGIVILILAYYLSSKFLSPSVAAISAILLSLDSSFATLSKYGGVFGFSIPIFTVTPLLFFYKWHITKKNLYFYLGMFFLGLGLNTKGWFIWFIISLLVSAIVLYIPHNKVKVKTILKGLICTLLGLIPLIYYIYFKKGLLEYMAGNFIITEFGISNLEVVKNLSIRLKELQFILMGPCGMGVIFRTFQGFFFWLCLVWLLYLALVKKRTKLPRNRVLFIIFLFLTLFLMSIFTFSQFTYGHLYILFPYIQILLGITIFEMFSYSKHYFRIIALLVLTILIGVNVAKCVETHRSLQNEKEQKLFCNIKVVSDWLLENKIYHPVGFDFLINQGAMFYSSQKIVPCPGPTIFVDKKKFFEYFRETVLHHQRINNIFIFDVSGNKREYEYFRFMSKEFNKEIIICKEFLWPNGEPRYVIVLLK